MVKPSMKTSANADQGETLRGWKQIAAFLGEPEAVVQRWRTQGMPVRREGRVVTATSDELNSWLGNESGKPVQVATESTDLATELKRGLSYIRRGKPFKAEGRSRGSRKKARC